MLDTLNARLERDKGLRLTVRVGIHTGLVVVGGIGGSDRQEQLALGDTPNIAARLQGLAAPDTVVISEATSRLVQGFFTCQALGAQDLKGLDQPRSVYRVLHASGRQTRLDVATPRGLTSLVGREQEVGLLLERWAQVKDSTGQVVFLTGEAGIGKSRLVQVLREQILGASATCIECRCSPHTQHSALRPVIAHWERSLAFAHEDTPDAKLRKLEDALAAYALPLSETVPLFAALLSLPQPARDAPVPLTPQRQRQKTLEVLLTWLVQETEQHPVLCIVEEEFKAPWGSRAYLTQLTLGRLGRSQVEAMVTGVLHGKPLPVEVLQQVVAKTDGVPLFVEEQLKMVLESELVREVDGRYVLTGLLPPLAIPATLQDALMARLDRLASAKIVAQLGTTIGRQFTYDLLQAVCPLDTETLQAGLRQLVEAELLYQRGLPPRRPICSSMSSSRRRPTNRCSRARDNSIINASHRCWRSACLTAATCWPTTPGAARSGTRPHVPSRRPAPRRSRGQHTARRSPVSIRPLPPSGVSHRGSTRRPASKLSRSSLVCVELSCNWATSNVPWSCSRRQRPWRRPWMIRINWGASPPIWRAIAF